MRLRPLLLLGLCTLYLSACSGIGLLNASIPTTGYKVTKDVAYGDVARQKLDIYVPDGVSKEKPAPVIMYIHGGSWQYGNKEDYPFLGEAFASKGYVVVIINYRLYPEVSFPTFIEDGASAFKWTHDHIAEYGGETKNLFLMGHSAGAHIAMMLSINHDYLKQAGAKPEWIKGSIGVSGPYDFLPLTDPKLIALFGTAKKPEDIEPINFVSGKIAPVFLATGDADDVVEMRNTTDLAKALRDKGTEVDMHIYPGLGHGNIMLSLAHGFRHISTQREDIDAFIKKHNQ